MAKNRSYVIFSSGNGSTNLGDESMWLAAAQTVRRVDPTATIVTDSSAGWQSPLPHVRRLPFLHMSLRRGDRLPSWISRRHQLSEPLVTFPFRNQYASARAKQIAEGKATTKLVEQWRHEILAASAVIFSGAGAITKDYATHGIFSWSLLTGMAREFNKPIAFIGQGVGPDISDSHRPWLKSMFGSATLITVREPKSAIVVSSIDSRLKAQVAYDWALALEPTYVERANADRIVEQLTDGRPYYALSFHRRGRNEASKLRRLAALADEVIAAAARDNSAVMFVSNMTAGSYSDDRKTAELIRRMMRRPQDLRVVKEQLTPGETMSVLAGSRGLVATRYHPLVFAFSGKTPSWGLSSDAYYDQKLGGISAAFGVRDNVSRISDGGVTGAQILERLRVQQPNDVSASIRDEVSRPLIDFLRHSCPE